MVKVQILSEEREVLDIVYRCPRCSQLAYGDKEVLELPLAVPLNLKKTIHLCPCCHLGFNTELSQGGGINV
jgi:hypothetical protein